MFALQAILLLQFLIIQPFGPSVSVQVNEDDDSVSFNVTNLDLIASKGDAIKSDAYSLVTSGLTIFTWLEQNFATSMVTENRCTKPL